MRHNAAARGAQLLGRALRVDHVAGYKKEKLRDDEAEREEQLERMKKSEVVRAWTKDTYNPKAGASCPRASVVPGLQPEGTARWSLADRSDSLVQILTMRDSVHCIFTDPTLRALTGADQIERDKREVRTVARGALGLWLPPRLPYQSQQRVV